MGLGCIWDLVSCFLFRGGLAGWLAGFAGGRSTKYLMAGTNRTSFVVGRVGVFGAPGVAGNFSSFCLRFWVFSRSCTTASDGFRPLILNAERIWGMSSMVGLRRNTWFGFLFRDCFEDSIFSKSTYFFSLLPHLVLIIAVPKRVM